MNNYFVSTTRTEIVDFSVPVYTDQVIGLVPLKIKDNRDARIEPFHWSLWVIIACLPPMYLLIMALSEYEFNHEEYSYIHDHIEIIINDPLYDNGSCSNYGTNTYIHNLGTFKEFHFRDSTKG